MKFGKKPPKVHPSTLRLSKYLPKVIPSDDFGVTLPAAPAKTFWEYRVPESQWQDFGNTTIGDCTVAAISHMLMNETAHTGLMVIPAIRDVLGFYSAVSGYIPGNDATDNGAAITDVLALQQSTGISGHKIVAWAAIDPTNIAAVKQGIFIFGSVDIGFNVPQYAMEQVQAMMDWTVMQGNSNIVGGHSVPLFGYGSLGATCVTWGKLQRMSWDFFKAYCDEAYVAISEDWLKAGRSPSGFNMDALRADIAALTVPPAV